MPRYFFFLETGVSSFRDEEGEDFPDDAAAHEEALLTATELAELSKWDGTIVVRDESGRFVSEIPVRKSAKN